MLHSLELVITAPTSDGTREEADAFLNQALGTGDWDMRAVSIEAAEQQVTGEDDRGRPVVETTLWLGRFRATPKE